MGIHTKEDAQSNPFVGLGFVWHWCFNGLCLWCFSLVPDNFTGQRQSSKKLERFIQHLSFQYLGLNIFHSSLYIKKSRMRYQNSKVHICYSLMTSLFFSVLVFQQPFFRTLSSTVWSIFSHPEGYVWYKL